MTDEPLFTVSRKQARFIATMLVIVVLVVMAVTVSVLGSGWFYAGFAFGVIGTTVLYKLMGAI